MTSCWLSAWYDPQQRVSLIFFHVRLGWSDDMSSNTGYDSKLIAMDKATSLLPCPSPLANWSQLLLQKVSIHCIHYRSQKEIIWLVRVFLEVIWSAHQPTSQVCLSLFCKLFLAICTASWMLSTSPVWKESSEWRVANLGIWKNLSLNLSWHRML